MVVVCFFGPFLSMSFCYFKIFRHVRASAKRLSGHSPSRNKNSSSNVSKTTIETSGVDSRTSSFTDVSQIPSISGDAKNDDAASDAGSSRVSYSKYEDPQEKRRREKQRKRRKDDVRLAMTFSIVILAFVISWLPFCVMMFWTVFATDSVPRIPDMVTLLLGFANSCYNPIIYGVMNKRFHAGYRRLFCGCWPCFHPEKGCCSEPETSSISSTIENKTSIKAKLAEWKRNWNSSTLTSSSNS